VKWEISAVLFEMCMLGLAPAEMMACAPRPRPPSRYIPKAATKVIVQHPACIDPSEVQEQLQKMTSNFMAKATGGPTSQWVVAIHVGVMM
jgi:hypothetical protein